MPLSVMPNFSKRSWFYLTLFICVCFCLFFVLFCCCCCYCCLDFFLLLFHCCSEVSSVSNTVERINECISNFLVEVVDMYSSTINHEDISHQLVKSSQRNILLLFLQYRKKGIYLYKTKQKLT